MVINRNRWKLLHLFLFISIYYNEFQLISIYLKLFHNIIPAPTTLFVASSIKIKLPVSLFRL